MLDIRALIDKILETLIGVQTDVSGKVNRSGDTMTGNLTLDAGKLLTLQSSSSNNTTLEATYNTLKMYNSSNVAYLDISTDNSLTAYTLGVRESSTKGNYSVGLGYMVSPTAEYTVAQNIGTNAVCTAQTAIGTYNVADTVPSTAVHPSGTAYGNYAFLIGNGSASTDRNLFTVRWDGRVYTNATGFAQNQAQYAIYINGDASMFVGVGSGGANHGVYSNKHNKWMIYMDDTNDIAYLQPGSVRIGGHSSAIGAQLTGSGNNSHSSGTTYNLITGCSVTLPIGSWIITYSAYCDLDVADKRLGAVLYNNTDSAQWNWARSISQVSTSAGTAVCGAMVYQATKQVVVQLRAYQNSGAAKTIYGYIRAMRIA